ncbi:hypothetical protein [Ureibacillus massiliensis]|uniref:hypothetical protein n=1 Tax=Ureibacillus massiliensis TaxID=292806 RepID=UPI000AC8FE53|nr:hypothetical protein [Ureibacillus massiliensis]BDH60446.1 hypothetical protein MTP04_05760 [Lysinibacillus sp. PLM2]
MKKEEGKFNAEAAMNNNLGSATIQMNSEIAKQHVKPKTEKTDTNKRNETKMV